MLSYLGKNNNIKCLYKALEVVEGIVTAEKWEYNHYEKELRREKVDLKQEIIDNWNFRLKDFLEKELIR